MKLNWFSPLPPLSTDVAHYSIRALTALSEHAEVVLWTEQEEVDPAIKEQFDVRRFTPESIAWEELNRADLTFYNIGNNPHFHDATWQISRRSPGVVILHDAHLHHFFDGIFLRTRDDAAGYLAQMEKHYGAEGRRMAQSYLDDATSYIFHMAERYPLTELALEGALCALTHSEHVFDNLRRRTRCPVAYAPLPYPARIEHDPPAQPSASDDAPRDDNTPRRLIVFGYLGPNRQLDALLRALAEMDERHLFHLDIYGQAWNEAYVQNIIRRLNLKERVTLHGFVPEDELETALATSDLAINLRYPTMGEASGSQLRLWSHALPSLVTDVDWYATLPRDAVAHVRPMHEVADIQNHLRELLRDPQRFRAMGERGRQTLTEQHAPETYTRTLLELVAAAGRLRARMDGYGLADRAIAEVHRWNEGALPGATAKAATEIAALTNQQRAETSQSRVSDIDKGRH